jgi:hypothetical protein
MLRAGTGVAGRHRSIGRTATRNNKINWILYAVQNIMSMYQDPVFKYDYYFDFRKYFVPLLDATFDWVGVKYVRKNTDDLSLDDIKNKIAKLAEIWDALDRFRHNQDPQYENVHRVHSIIQLLKEMAGYDFDDKKLWIFYQQDDTFQIDRCDVGAMNPNQKHDDMDTPEYDDELEDNPEADNDMEFMNPDKSNKNPLRRRIVVDADNPEGIPNIDDNPVNVESLLHELEHYI